MSVTRYWRVRKVIEDAFEEHSRLHYHDIIQFMDKDVKDVFYSGIVVQELVHQGKIFWESSGRMLARVVDSRARNSD